MTHISLTVPKKKERNIICHNQFLVNSQSLKVNFVFLLSPQPPQRANTK